MRSALCICFALLSASLSAATLDFAISVNFLSRYDRFAADAQGNILIASAPQACNLPTLNPISTCGPIWIGKLDPTGQRLIFATYLGSGLAGPAQTQVAGIAADSAGNIVVAGHLVGNNLPAVNAYQSAPGSAYYNVYVAKVSADGAQILYDTYLGGSGAAQALSLTLDGVGAAYIAVTCSADFPTTPQSAHQGGGLFTTAIAKLGADGQLRYGAIFPFEFYADLKPVQVDSAGAAWLASPSEILRVSPDGSTLSRTPLPNFAPPTQPWVFPRAGGGFAFLGTASGGIPVMGNALEAGEAAGYIRIEDGSARQPALPPPVNGLAVDPANRNRIYAATGGGLFRSEDNGWTWTSVRAGAASAIAIDANGALYLVVASNPPLLCSLDGGGTWTPLAPDVFKGSQPTSIDTDPNTPGSVYLTANDSVYASRDGGETWNAQVAGPAFPQYDGSGQLFAADRLVRADGAHRGWAYVAGTVQCIGFCPVTGFLWRTEDGGATWTALDGFPGAASAMAVDPNSGDVAVTLANTGVGSAWLYAGGGIGATRTLLAGPSTAVAFDPQNAGAIYLAVQVSQGPGSGYFVLESTDDGATWTTIMQTDRAVSGLVVGAGGVLHGLQAPNPPLPFLVLTDATGAAQYATYFAGAYSQVNTAAMGMNGLFYAAGSAKGGLQLFDPFQAALAGGANGFLCAFDGGGNLVWGTYLGGSASDSIDVAQPQPDGSVLLVGTTTSANFPMLQNSPLGGGNTFIARIRP